MAIEDINRLSTGNELSTGRYVRTFAKSYEVLHCNECGIELTPYMQWHGYVDKYLCGECDGMETGERRECTAVGSDE